MMSAFPFLRLLQESSPLCMLLFQCQSYPAKFSYLCDKPLIQKLDETRIDLLNIPNLRNFQTQISVSTLHSATDNSHNRKDNLGSEFLFCL